MATEFVILFYFFGQEKDCFSGWMLPSDVSKWHCGFTSSSEELNGVKLKVRGSCFCLEDLGVKVGE